MLVRSQIVLHRNEDGWFRDADDWSAKVMLTGLIDQDMGWPETITVTVVPGDAFNDGQADG